MLSNIVKIRPIYVALLFAALALSYCNPAKKTGSTAGKPPGKTQPSDRPQFETMDTIRWSENTGGKPPIGSAGNSGGQNSGDDGSDFSGQKFRIALLLPFLTHQADTARDGVPEKSRLATQFYAGARLALELLSTEDGMNLTVDVFDTKANDSDFEKLLASPKLDLAQVYLGPIRSSHVSALAKKTKINRKILVSPESPNADLTSGNPTFIQMNPSLKAHCEAIARYVSRRHAPDEVLLVCKQKESERLAYLQNANTAGGRFRELVVPDATENFDKTDLKPYFKAGKTSVFVLPSWASQDFVFAFFRRVKAQMGKNKVAIYGMPQWMKYENIEPDYFQSLDVHLSSASFVDYAQPDVQAFRQKFYENFGTVPDDDAFNGFDTMLFTGKMLKKYGLDFPAKLAREQFATLHGKVRVAAVSASGSDRFDAADYLENKFVHILRFENFAFVPVQD